MHWFFLFLESFIIGFFFPIFWYVGAFMLFCATKDEPREKPGFTACLIAVSAHIFPKHMNFFLSWRPNTLHHISRPCWVFSDEKISHIVDSIMLLNLKRKSVLEFLTIILHFSGYSLHSSYHCLDHCVGGINCSKMWMWHTCAEQKEVVVFLFWTLIDFNFARVK